MRWGRDMYTTLRKKVEYKCHKQTNLTRKLTWHAFGVPPQQISCYSGNELLSAKAKNKIMNLLDLQVTFVPSNNKK